MNGSLPQISAVCRKELRIYFGSPLALIFVGVFLSISLFLFFWAETFFTRNIADVRPLFRWMPPLMIFFLRERDMNIMHYFFCRFLMNSIARASASFCTAGLTCLSRSSIAA